MNKDKPVNVHDREVFLNNLRQFYKARGLHSFDVNVRLGGRPVDLHLLYNVVSELGGSIKVNDQDKWNDILVHFHVPQACGNASFALKQIFQKYLAAYERVNRLDLDVEQTEEDEVGLSFSSKKRSVAGSFSALMSAYTTPGAQRQSFDGGVNMPVDQSRYRKIEKSLLSGLPNEVDFAINVLTLLSSEGRHTLRLQECPSIVDLLLAHAGIFSPERPDLQELYHNSWRKNNSGKFIQFWRDSFSNKKFTTSDLISADDFPTSNNTEDIDLELISLEEDCVSNDDCVENSNLLLLGRNLGLQDVEGQRVLQIAMIIRNLSFDESNMDVLASKKTIFRFLLMCIYSCWHNLKQLAFDTLSNIALKIILNSSNISVSKVVLNILGHGLVSSDRFDVVCSLDLLSRLSQVAASEDLLCLCLTPSLFNHVVQLLTVQDIQLVISALEALYQLSELGNTTCTHIASIHGSIGTLVSLLTVEAQSYGPSALINIKVVEHVPAMSGVSSVMPPPPPGSVNVIHSQPAVMSTPALIPRIPLRPTLVMSAPLQQVPVTPSVRTSVPAPVVPSVNHDGGIRMGQNSDLEISVCNWLSSQLQLSSNIAVSALQVYREYLAVFSHTGRVVDSSTFSRCLRTVFPSVEISQVTRPDGLQDVIYQGVMKRPPVHKDLLLQQPVAAHTPLHISTASNIPSVAALPAVCERVISPQQYPAIQQALCGNNERPMSRQSGCNTPNSQSCPTSPTLSPNFSFTQSSIPMCAISPPPNGNDKPIKAPGTSVIKSLLANKVSRRNIDNNANSVQSIRLSSSTAGFQNAYQAFVTCVSSNTNPSSSINQPVSVAALSSESDNINQSGIKKKKKAKKKVNASEDDVSILSASPSVKKKKARPSRTRKKSVTSDPSVAFEVCKGVELAQNIVQEEQGEHEARIEKVVNVQVENKPVDNVGHKLSDCSSNVNCVNSNALLDKNSQSINGVTCLDKHEKMCVVKEVNKDKGICNGSDDRLEPQFLDDNSNSIAEEVLDSMMMNGDDYSVDDEDAMEEDAEDEASAHIKELSREKEQEILKKLKVDGILSSLTPKLNGIANHLFNGKEVSYNHKITCGEDTVGNFNTDPKENSVSNKAEAKTDSKLERCVQSNADNLSKKESSKCNGVNSTDVKASLQQPQISHSVVSTAHLNGLVGDVKTDNHVISVDDFDKKKILPVEPEETNEKATIGCINSENVAILVESSEISSAKQGGCNVNSQFVNGQNNSVAETNISFSSFVISQNANVSSSVHVPISMPVSNSRSLISPNPPAVQRKFVPIAATPVTSVNAPVVNGPMGHYVSIAPSIIPRPPGAAVQTSTNNGGQTAFLRCFQQPNGQLAWGLFPAVVVNNNNGISNESNLPNGDATASSQSEPFASSSNMFPNLQAPGGVVIPSNMQSNRPPMQCMSQQSLLPQVMQCLQQQGVRVMLPPRNMRPQVMIGPPGGPCMVRQVAVGFPMQGQRLMVASGLPSPNQLRPIMSSGNVQSQLNVNDQPQGQLSPSSSGTCSAKKRPARGKAGEGEAETPKPKKKKKSKSARSESSESRNSASPGSLPTSPPPWCHPALRSPPLLSVPQFFCEWRGCERSFMSVPLLRSHVIKEHVNRNSSHSVCQWEGCDGLQRQLWSLVTHLQDRHLTEQYLHAAAMRRQQAGSPPPLPQLPPVTIYPQDAAYQAIRRFFVPPPYPELMEGKPEGPVTKHIRLTAALILRNLAHYSPLGCSLVKHYENQLAYIAMSAVESSNVISACLFDLHRQ